MTEDQIIDDIIRREGRVFVNHPADRGGPTKFGITQKTLAGYRGKDVTPEDVAALTEEEARAIYRSDFLIFGKIESEALRALLIDSGVNHGQGNAVKFLQRALGVDADGILGPQTLEAVRKMNADTLYLRVLAERMKFYGKIVSRDPVLKKAREAGFHLQAENAEGWANRLNEFF